MAASLHDLKVQTVLPREALADRYDLVMTFDYENIHTSIEHTAHALKERLTEVGLGPGHGKTLHIIAHSMGGLVARWLIEHEAGGNQMVQHLVMVGTPNRGSPWPTLQGWATMALGIGLNVLGATIWSVEALGGLIAAIEKIDVTLDQMQPNSTLLQNLANGPPIDSITACSHPVAWVLLLPPRFDLVLVEHTYHISLRYTRNYQPFSSKY